MTPLFFSPLPLFFLFCTIFAFLFFVSFQRCINIYISIYLQIQMHTSTQICRYFVSSTSFSFTCRAKKFTFSAWFWCISSVRAPLDHGTPIISLRYVEHLSRYRDSASDREMYRTEVTLQNTSALFYSTHAPIPLPNRIKATSSTAIVFFYFFCKWRFDAIIFFSFFSPVQRAPRVSREWLYLHEVYGEREWWRRAEHKGPFKWARDQ